MQVEGLNQEQINNMLSSKESLMSVELDKKPVIDFYVDKANIDSVTLVINPTGDMEEATIVECSASVFVEFTQIYLERFNHALNIARRN